MESDAAETERTDAGDRWEELLLAERAALHRFVASLAGYDPHHVEDIVQETLLRAWQLARRLDWREQPIRMWLFRVARNLLIDDWRQNRAVPIGISATDFSGLAPASDEVMTRALDRRMVIDALRSLKPAHRDALIQVHLLDRTGEDAARVLGVPSGTVKSRAHHGLLLLRRRLRCCRGGA
ncbi:sigma-70 family RNA polymerase sigma factor [Thermopolyspora sp. NPDC052614]|uniref:sigma-70 family RNA polymerase sigma factor n=1 Tax=Thermopolyspora sp. NPDC052614 TaxID=3155682 RepID=UPI00343B88D5